MRHLDPGRCSFCDKHAEVFEHGGARICRECLGRAMACAMKVKPREPETEGDKQEAETAPT